MGNQINQQVVDCIAPKKSKSGKKDRNRNGNGDPEDADGAFDFEDEGGMEGDQPNNRKSSKRSKRGDRNSSKQAGAAGAGAGLFPDDGNYGDGDYGDGLPTSLGAQGGGDPSFGHRLDHISTSLRGGGSGRDQTQKQKSTRGRHRQGGFDDDGAGAEEDEDTERPPPARGAPRYEEESGQKSRNRRPRDGLKSNDYYYDDRDNNDGGDDGREDERANLEEEPPIIDFTPLPDFPMPEEAEMQHLYELNTIGQVLTTHPELSAHRPDLELRRCKDAFARYRDEHSAPWVEDFSTDPFAMWRPPIQEEAASQAYPQLAPAALSPTLGFGGFPPPGGSLRGRFALPASQQPQQSLQPSLRGGGGSLKPAWVNVDRPAPRSAPPGAMGGYGGSIGNANRTNMASVGPPSSTVVPTRLAANVSRRPPSATGGGGMSMPASSRKGGKPAITGYQPAGSSTSLISKGSAKTSAPGGGSPGPARTWSPQPPSHTLPPRGANANTMARSMAAGRPPHSSAFPIS